MQSWNPSWRNQIGASGSQRRCGSEPSGAQRKVTRWHGACLAYNSGTVEEKRDLLDALTSDRIIDGKFPMIVLSLPFRAIAERPKGGDGVPRRATRLTWKPLLLRLTDLFFQAKPTHLLPLVPVARSQFQTSIVHGADQPD